MIGNLPARGLVAGAAFAALTILAVGCGAGTSSPSVAHLRTAVSTSASSPAAPTRQTGALYASCMRAHGVTSFPDSAVSVTAGQVEFDIPRSTKSEPQFPSASRACQADLPGGGPSARKPVNMREELRFARCMRAHGIADFPDPMPNGGFDVAGDTGSQRFTRAVAACQARRGSPGVHWNSAP